MAIVFSITNTQNGRSTSVTIAPLDAVRIFNAYQLHQRLDPDLTMAQIAHIIVTNWTDYLISLTQGTEIASTAPTPIGKTVQG